MGYIYIKNLKNISGIIKVSSIDALFKNDDDISVVITGIEFKVDMDKHPNLKGISFEKLIKKLNLHLAPNS